MGKNKLNLHIIQNRNWVAQNLIDDFLLILIIRGPFHGKDFKRKKNGGTGLILEKIKVL